jgi:hypothetical protein
VPRDALDVETDQGNLLYALDGLDYLCIAFVGTAVEERSDGKGVQSTRCECHTYYSKAQPYEQHDRPEPNLCSEKFHDESAPTLFDAEMPYYIPRGVK